MNAPLHNANKISRPEDGLSLRLTAMNLIFCHLPVITA